MKTLEEPPYLTVGTDVSAKYRGAFCEAKIKTAKRLVKAKVTFKPDSSTVEVHDENIRGPLKVGAVVEVKNQDGIYQEATINKLTDASLYTVVFDDGDEKTLRRSSLCLKGARHFAESETLDRLPLTNPEHFGTPVIRKKGNRGRRSNPVQEEESSSSSSEEEESDQRQNDDLFGTVVCVEGVATGDKKKSTWYPALVISPDCHEDVTMKKDSIFVRSFKDGKFNTVLRKDVRELDGAPAPKADAGLKPALDAAWGFVRNGTVPVTWRTEVKDESSSSEEEEGDEEEEQEEDASSEEEDEEEVELFPEERENFLQQLYKFMEDRGTPINKRPVLGYRNLNLFKLYRLVHKLGGFENIDSGSVWKQVYQDLGIPVLNSAAGYNVKCAYRKYLYGFEEYCTSTGISFRMDLPLKPAEKPTPKGEVKTEGGARAVTLATSVNSEELKSGVDGEPSGVQPVVKEDCAAAAVSCPAKVDPSALKKEEKNNENDDEEEAEMIDCNSEVFIKHEEEGSGLVAPHSQSDAMAMPETCKESDNKDLSGADSSQEGEEGEEFECYPPGMKVQVRYGRGRNQKTYEATVKESDLEGGEVLYLVHYCGWNIRYDEWVKADKIVRPANKNVPKVKHRKKIKNKAERDKTEQLSDHEDLSPSKNNRVNRSSKPDSTIDLSSRMDESYEEGNQPSLEINGQQASESSSDDSEREEDDEADPDGDENSLRHVDLQKGSLTNCWENTNPPDCFRMVEASGNGQDVPEMVKRKGQSEPDGEPVPRKRKSEVLGERTPKSQTKSKTRSGRAADWLSGSLPKKLEERISASMEEEQEEASSSSSEDEDCPATELQVSKEQRGNPKTRGSPVKKYNGVKEAKTKGGRSAAFWEIPKKKPKVPLGSVEERMSSCRPKGQKDVWSSIQAQWPKKTLKELFSDSDPETQSPPPPPPASSAPEEHNVALEPDEDEAAEEEQLDNDKYPSSGSNSVLNTPPTTPESPALSGGAEPSASTQPPSAGPPAPPPAAAAILPSGSPTAPSPAEPPTEEGARSESDSSTVEVESVGGEAQELHQEDQEAASPSKAFEGSISCNSSCSLELSSGSQQEGEQKTRGRTRMEQAPSGERGQSYLLSSALSGHKRPKETPVAGVPTKKPKRSHKTLGLHPKKSRKTAHSSDSEDQSMSENASKATTSDLKAAISPKCPGRTPPLSGHKYHKHGDSDHAHAHHREHHGRGSRVYKWSFQMADLEKMSSLERITFLQEKLQDIRNHYLSLKSEVASIDRRRKRLKKKERETGAVAASSSSSSSSPSSSSLTAAVMLTLAEPTVSGSAQNSGVSVECR
ncbi:AT-rich interactive domain-containing protein 4B isoform X3 [Denticeps clupeoides]|uniref:AT-rich interactive domain-containing protein 4B isoform X3 n=1 Tax=Denticeps clupeoides TaxID=299321 RepID=UPI0010A50C4C|nr:AT-rich interactive domain-containing protein 4B isoform X3 [Denticeps clupeoides]